MESYKRYGSALLRKAMRILQNQDDAQDIVQAVFVELLSRGQTEPDLPYLYSAVTRRCIGFMRDRDNRERLLRLQQPALRGTVRIECERMVIDLDLLVKLSEKLDPVTHEVLVYRYYDEMTQEEIASILGVSRRSINRRIQEINRVVAALHQPKGPSRSEEIVS
jgi:RNA polymerase sigma-70 factor (ECF subfamily)